MHAFSPAVAVLFNTQVSTVYFLSQSLKNSIHSLKNSICFYGRQVIAQQGRLRNLGTLNIITNISNNLCLSAFLCMRLSNLICGFRNAKMSQRITYFSPVSRHFGGGGGPQKSLSNFLFGMRLSNLICGFRNAKMSQSVSISSLTPYVYQEMSQQPNLSLPSWSEFDAIMSQPFNPTQPNRPKSTQATCKSVSESTSQPNMSLPSWREEMVRVITPLRADNLEVVPILTESYKETFMV